MLRWCRKFVLLLLVAAGSAMAADTPPSVGTLVSLAVEREVSAHNDLATATLFVEDTDKDPRVLAERINRRIESGLKTAHAHPAVNIRSGNRQATPIYDEKQRAIVGWRERAELLLESTDLAAMSRLVEALQGGWSLAGMVLQPSPATRAKAADQATLDAIEAFRTQAELVSGALGGRYRIKELSINTQGGRPPVFRMARAGVMAEGAGMPIEAGESKVVVGISGTIELLD
jgi:predicted secreted protein